MAPGFYDPFDRKELSGDALYSFRSYDKLSDENRTAFVEALTEDLLSRTQTATTIFAEARKTADAFKLLGSCSRKDDLMQTIYGIISDRVLTDIDTVASPQEVRNLIYYAFHGATLDTDLKSQILDYLGDRLIKEIEQSDDSLYITNTISTIRGAFKTIAEDFDETLKDKIQSALFNEKANPLKSWMQPSTGYNQSKFFAARAAYEAGIPIPPELA